MIIRRFKNILSSILITTLLGFYIAPVGLCSSVGSQGLISTGVQKPALREGSSLSAFKLEGDISITKSNRKLCVCFRDSDVQNVLRMFADQAGLNIIIHDSVQGKISMDLVGVPINDAFKMVMQTANLTYYIDKNTLIVMSAETAKSLTLVKQELMILPVKYLDATVLADFLNTNIFSGNKPGLSNSQVAITNPSTNDILIVGSKNDYLMAKKIVNQFDVKPLEETFTVNHTTPKEMADLLCRVLFKNTGTVDNSSVSASSVNKIAKNSNKTENGTKKKINPRFAFSSKGVLTGAADTLNTIQNNGGTSAGTNAGISLGAGVIACQYNNDIKTKSLSSLKTANLSVTYFPQKGTIFVRGGSAQQMEMVKDFIAKNDKKEPQALLEVAILELNETGTKEFDNTWQVWSSFFSGTFSGTTTTNSLYPTFFAGDGYRVVDSSNPSTVKYSVSKFTGTPMVTYAINYILQNSKGRILANPRIVITNGQPSKIDLSSDYVKNVTAQVITGVTGTISAIERTYNVASDEGLIVTIEPFISPDGYVTMNVQPKYSTQKEKVYDTDASGTTVLAATLLQRRNLDLKNLRIKDGETLIIGGLNREDESKVTKKIPVLGDLPGVGMFFRNTNNIKEKQELVIMLTPRIIKDNEDTVNNGNTAL